MNLENITFLEAFQFVSWSESASSTSKNRVEHQLNKYWPITLSGFCLHSTFLFKYIKSGIYDNSEIVKWFL